MSVNSRPLIGNEPVKVLIRDSKNTNVDQTASNLILAKHGKAVVSSEAYTVIAKHSPLNTSWSYGVANHLKTGESISAKLDFKGSENLVLSSCMMNVTKTIEPG